MQQVRAEIKEPIVPPYEYLFESESVAFEPEFAEGDELHLPEDALEQPALDEARAGYSKVQRWKLVKGLVRLGAAREKDEAALRLAAPESGSFILVSLRRRRR